MDFTECPHDECASTDSSRRVYKCLDPRDVGCAFQGCWNSEGEGCWGTHVPCPGCGASGTDTYEYVGHIVD